MSADRFLGFLAGLGQNDGVAGSVAAAAPTPSPSSAAAALSSSSSSSLTSSSSSPATSSSSTAADRWLIIDGMAELRAAFFESVGAGGGTASSSASSISSFMTTFLGRIDHWRQLYPPTYLVVAFEDPAHLPMPRTCDTGSGGGVAATAETLEMLAYRYQKAGVAAVDQSALAPCFWPSQAQEAAVFWATLPLQWRLRKLACEALATHLSAAQVSACLLQALWMPGGDSAIGNRYREFAAAADREVAEGIGRRDHLPPPVLGLDESAWRLALREMLVARRVDDRLATVSLRSGMRPLADRPVAAAAAGEQPHRAHFHAYVAALGVWPSIPAGADVWVVATATPEAALATFWMHWNGRLAAAASVHVVTAPTGAPFNVTSAAARLIDWGARLVHQKGDARLHKHTAGTFFAASVAQTALPFCTAPPPRESKGRLVAAALNMVFLPGIEGTSPRLAALRARARRSFGPDFLEELLAWIAYQAFLIDVSRGYLAALPRGTPERQEIIDERWCFFPETGHGTPPFPAPTSSMAACRARAYRTQWLLRYWSGRSTATSAAADTAPAVAADSRSNDTDITAFAWTGSPTGRRHGALVAVSLWGWRGRVSWRPDDWLGGHTVPILVPSTTGTVAAFGTVEGVDLVLEHDDDARHTKT